MDDLKKRLAHLTPEKKALLALRFQEKQPPRKEVLSDEPIAVVGLGCRFPGNVTDPYSYWQMLAQAGDAIGDIPAERWDVSAYYSPEPAAQGKMNTRWGGFLKDVDKFDPKFFNISPREAINLDPQQRLLLEVSWESLRDADLSPEKLAGSSTGVFIGISSNDYADLQMVPLLPESVDAYYGTGNSNSFAAGRISYWLGAQGPSMAVDTACSSSLVAVHLACQSLRAGECRIALAGGVNLILSPIGSVYLSQVRALSPSGRCRTFSADADGIVRGEGCGIVVLKRLSDALEAGDAIWAVIRGTAVNQDGRSNGLTAPNGLAQEALIRQALENAGVEAGQIGYVETHGTGTPLGDPIEVRALHSVLRENNDAPPLMIGSVKTNFGHLEAAAGIAGLIKAVLSLHQRAIPANLHFRQPSTHIPWTELSLKVPVSMSSWAAPESHGRIAGVSSFGFSGTNAHLVVEDAAGLQPPVKKRELVPSLPAPWRKERFWTEPAADLRAHSAAIGENNSQIEVFAGELVAESEIRNDPALENSLRKLRQTWGLDGCFAVNRFQLAPFVFFTKGQRSFFYTNKIENSLIALIYVGSPVDLPESINEFVRYAERNQLEPNLFLLEEDLDSARKYGLSATPCGVWQEISDLDSFSLNGNRMRRLRYAVSHYRKSGNCRLDEYFPDGNGQALEEIEQVIDEWMTHKDKPATFVKPLKRLLSGSDTEHYRFFLVRRSGRLESFIVLSAYGQGTGFLMDLEFYRQDAPFGCVEFGIVQILEILKREGCRKLSLGGTFGVRLDDHPLADSTTAEFFSALFEEGILNGSSNYQFKAKFRPQERRMFVCRPAGADGGNLYNLLLMLGDPLGARSAGKNIRNAFEVKAVSGTASVGANRTDGSFRARVDEPNPLLGKPLLLAAVSETIFETRLSRARMPYLREHRLRSHTLFPGAAFLEMLNAAGTAYFKNAPFAIKDVLLYTPLFCEQEAEIVLQLKLTPQAAEPGCVGAEIYSLNIGSETDNDSWQLHVSAQLSAEKIADDSPGLFELPARIIERCQREMVGTEFYQKLGRAGFAYGPLFQGVRQIWFNEREVLGSIELPDALADPINTYHFHPVLLDACFQVMAALSPNFVADSFADLFLLHGIERFESYRRPAERLWCYAIKNPEESASKGDVTARLVLFDEVGNLIAEIDNLQAKWATPNLFTTETAVPINDWFYEISWQPTASARLIAPDVSDLDACLIFGEENCHLTRALAKRLSAARIDCRLVLPDSSSSSSSSSATDAVEAFSSWQTERIDPEKPAIYRDLYRKWMAATTTSLPAGSRAKRAAVVWLWSVGTAEPLPALSEAIDSAEAAASEQSDESGKHCRRLLYLIQALAEGAEEASEQEARLWIVTAEAQSAEAQSAQSLLSDEGDAEPMSGVAAAGVWGLGVVLEREHPELLGAMIDLERETTRGERASEGAEQIYREMFAHQGADESESKKESGEESKAAASFGTGAGTSSGAERRERQVCYRRGQRYAARLRRARIEADESRQDQEREARVREDGWYLVSGGLGGLGLAVGGWLLAEGAGRVVLVSRGRGRGKWREAVAEYERRYGAERVSAVESDIGEWRQVRELIEEENRRGEGKRRLRGIIHSAGEVSDAVLVRQSREKLESVMRAKVRGGWNLHYASRKEEELDFFVLFSSAVVVLANPGQSNHAAANMSLDGLAHYRRSQKLPALSINWSGWDEIGAASHLDVSLRAAELGIKMISPVLGIKAFTELLRTTRKQVIVLPIDWRKWQDAPQRHQPPSLLVSFVKESFGENDAKIRQTEIHIESEDLKGGISGKQQAADIGSYLRRLVAELLDISEKELDSETQLSEYGFDSLMTVDLRGRLIRDRNVNLAVNDLFGNLTLKNLEQRLELLLDAKTAKTKDPGIYAERDLLNNIERLSEEEIDELLKDRLAAQRTLKGL